jgi:hypothetical protein
LSDESEEEESVKIRRFKIERYQKGNGFVTPKEFFEEDLCVK